MKSKIFIGISIACIFLFINTSFAAVENYEQDIIAEPEEAKEGEEQEQVDVVAVNEEIRKLHQKISTNLWEEDGDDVELKTADDIDIQQMQMKRMRIENRTADPSSPATGEIWFRTNL